MSPLSYRWAQFVCWIEEMPWAKVNFFLGAAVFVANTVAWWIAEAAASISTVYLDKGMTVEHDPFIWIYGAAATWSGLNGAGFQLGKRLTSKPEVMRVEAEIQERRTGTHRAIPEAPKPNAGDRPVLTDHDRGVI